MEISIIMYALLRFELNNSKISDAVKNALTPDRMQELYVVSKRHDIAHLVADALDKNKLLPIDSEERKRFLRERNMAVYRYEQMQYEYNQICETLECANIAFVPLKGAVLRSYYPEPWMRTSCDIDILVKQEDLTTAIETLKEKLQYRVNEAVGAHDISLFASTGIHLELHFSLLENHDELDKVLSRVWDNVELSETRSVEYCQTKEFLLFHIISHTAYHLIVGGGCGVRALIDLWLLETKLQCNAKKVEAFCEECGLLTFYHKLCALVKKCMSGEALSEEENVISSFIIQAKLYGDVDNRAAFQQVKRKGKLRAIATRLFLPYSELARQYPILKKYKILFPIYQLVRWGRLCFGKNAKNFKREVKVNLSIDSTKREEAKKILDILGL